MPESIQILIWPRWTQNKTLPELDEDDDEERQLLDPNADVMNEVSLNAWEDGKCWK